MWPNIDVMYIVASIVIGVETFVLLALVERVQRLRRHEDMVQRRSVADQFLDVR